MQKTDKFLINRFKWRASRFELSKGYTFHYEDLSPNIKEYLDGFLEGETSGTPVLFFTKPTNEWTLICTRCIMYCSDNIHRAVKIGDIKNITSTIVDDLRQVPLAKRSKSNLDRLTIYDNQNKKHVLHTYNGQDHFALYNVLLMATALVKNDNTGEQV